MHRLSSTFETDSYIMKQTMKSLFTNWVQWTTTFSIITTPTVLTDVSKLSKERLMPLTFERKISNERLTDAQQNWPFERKRVLFPSFPMHGYFSLETVSLSTGELVECCLQPYMLGQEILNLLVGYMPWINSTIRHLFYVKVRNSECLLTQRTSLAI